MRLTRLAVALIIIGIVSGASPDAWAGSVSFDFNDGNANGWIFPYNSGQTQFPGGVWGVENGSLAQYTLTDGNAGLVDNLVLSDQVIEAQVRTTRGYAGLVLWYQQVDSAWANYIAITTGGRVDEYVDGQAHTYYYDVHGLFQDTIWNFYDLKVEANSATGDLAVYLDGVYLFTHNTSTAYRTGLSGVYSGNEHGYFDNFSVTSDDISSVPEPSILLLFGIGLAAVSLAGLRWKK